MAFGFGGAIDNLIVAVVADVTQFNRGIDEATRGVNRFDRDVGRAAGGVSRMDRALAGLGRSAAGAFGVAALGAVFGKASKAAADFETEMAKVSTLLDDTSGIDALGAAMGRLSQQFGLPAVEQASGLFEIMAAGIEDSAKALEILDVANRLAVGGVTNVATAAGGLTSILSAFRDTMTDAAKAADILFIAAAAGKALDLDTPIPTPDRGFVPLRDIEAGDAIFDEKGEEHVVLIAHNVIEDAESYRVSFSDGTSLMACKDHNWFTYTDEDRICLQVVKRGLKYVPTSSRKLRGWRAPAPRVRTTAELLNDLRPVTGKFKYRQYIQLPEPVRFDARKYAIDPYILGLWLGDGVSMGAGFSTADPEVAEAFAGAGYQVVKRPGDNYDYGVRTAPGVRLNDGSLYRQLKTANLIANKHVPGEYLVGSVEQRLALLQGLMDTDGSIDRSGRCEFCSTNRNLADGVKRLLDSLGMRARVTFKPMHNPNHRDAYRVHFSPTLVNPFRLPRKRERVKLRYSHAERFVAITAIEKIPNRPMRCLTVSSRSALFLVGHNFIVTHNTDIAELSKGIGSVAPIAASLGVSFEEVAAAIAALTKGGVSSDEAFTGLRAILASVLGATDAVKAEAKAMGIEFTAAGIQAKGFAGFMADVVQQTGGSAQKLQALFGNVRAILPVLDLAGPAADAFADSLLKMQTQSGATDIAVAKMLDTTAKAKDILRETFAGAFRNLGGEINAALLPVTRGLARNFDDIALAVRSLTKSLGLLAGGFVAVRTAMIGVAVAQTVAAFLSLARTVRSAADAMALLRVATLAFNLPLAAATAAVAALGGAFFLAGRRAREAREEAEKMLASFKEGLGVESVRTLEIERERDQREQMRRLERIAQLNRTIADAAPTASGLDSPHVRRARQELELLNIAEERYVKEAVARELELNRRRAELEPLKIPDVTPPKGIVDTVAAFTELSKQVDATATRVDFFKSKLDELGRISLLTGRDTLVGRELVSDQLLTDVKRLEGLLGIVNTQLRANNSDLEKSAQLMELQRKIVEQLATLTPKIDLTFLPQVEVFDPFGDFKSGKKVAKEVNDASIAAQRLASGFDAASTAGRGLLQIADGLGKIGDATRKALDGVLGLVDAFGQLAQARKFAADAAAATAAGETAGAAAASSAALLSKVSGIVAAIGAFVSIVSSILGGASRAEQERIAAVRGNSETMERLRRTLEGFIRTAAGSFGAAGSIQPILDQVAAAIARAVDISRGRSTAGLLGTGPGAAVKFIEDELRRLGASLGQLEAYADSLGIVIRDSAGKLIPDALNQLRDALRLAAQEAATFGNSIRDQATVADARVQILDLDTGPVAEAQRALDFLGENLGGSVARMFQGIDVSTEVGRAAAEEAIRRVFGFVEAGKEGAFGIDPRLLGQFETIEEFLEFLLKADSALDSFTDTVSQATSAMRNVPASFKVAPARFNAETPVLSGGPQAPFVSDPGFFPPGGFGGATGVVIQGDVYVDARTKPVDVALDELTAAQRRRKQSATGTTDHPWDTP